MSVTVTRVSDRVVEIRDGLILIRVEGEELDRVADALAIYADMCPCGNTMCLGCGQSERWNDPVPQPTVSGDDRG